MLTPAELRAEARRCLDASRDSSDREAKRRFAARAFELAQQAEAMERSALGHVETNGSKQTPR